MNISKKIRVSYALNKLINSNAKTTFYLIPLLFVLCGFFYGGTIEGEINEINNVNNNISIEMLWIEFILSISINTSMMLYSAEYTNNNEGFENIFIQRSKMSSFIWNLTIMITQIIIMTITYHNYNIIILQTVYVVQSIFSALYLFMFFLMYVLSDYFVISAVEYNRYYRKFVPERENNTITASLVSHNTINESLSVNEHHECTICLEAINQDDTVSTTQCNHTFHKQCIDEWVTANLQSNTFTCPVCRSILEIEIHNTNIDQLV